MAVITLCSLCVQAQLPGTYTVLAYTTENGLPSNGIKGLEFDDSTGFLWMGTEAGVARFNGTDFKTFSQRNLEGLTQERILYLIRDHRNQIFFSDLNDHLFRVNNHMPSLTEEHQSNADIFLDRRYLKIIKNPELGLKIRSLKKEDTETYIETAINCSDSSALLLGYRKSIFYITSGQENLKQLISADEEPKILFKCDESIFLLHNKKGFFRFDEKLLSFIPVALQRTRDCPSEAAMNEKGLIWQNGMRNPLLFCGQKAWQLKFQDDTLTAELICSDIPNQALITYAQYNAKRKLLFLGTDSKGLLVMRPKWVVPQKNTDQDITRKNAYYAQVELSNGSVLTNEAHVIGPKPADPGLVPIQDKFNYTVFTLGDSLLLYAQTGHAKPVNHLHAYHYPSGKTIPFPKIEVFQTFAAATSKNELYVALANGLGKLQADSIEYIFRIPPNQIKNSYPTAMCESTPGKFLVASCKGLLEYDVNNKQVDTLLSLGNICIRSINKIRNHFFIGTYGGGMYILQGRTIRKMPFDKNEYLRYTHCVIPDSLGFCWISTNRGLFKASVDDLIHAFHVDSPQVYYHYLGRQDGMEMTEMNGGCLPCAITLKNKVISFPTMDGLLWVNPAYSNPPEPQGRMFTDELMVNNEDIYVGLEIDSFFQKPLSAGTRSIQIKLGFDAWCNKENIIIDYKLQEADAWQRLDIQHEPVIRLENLTAGDYQLTLRKVNGFGKDNFSMLRIPFTIKKPWYNQWWFFGLILISFLGLLRLYLNYRTALLIKKQIRLENQILEKTEALQYKNAELEKNNTINTRLISIISHDIITPLKFLALGGKELLNSKEQMPEELQKETIQQITHTAQELQLLSTNIMNWIKYQNQNRRQEKEKFNLHELAEQVIQILQSIAKQKNTRILNTIPNELVIFQYIEPTRILLYNLLTNAIQFSTNSDIIISAEKEAESVTLHVQDFGVGMTEGQVTNILSNEIIISSANVDNRKGNGLGYLIIKDLLKLVGGKLAIESERGKGTRVSVTLFS